MRDGLIVLLVLSAGIFAQTPSEKSVTACDVAAFVADTSSGVNIRQSSGTDKKILKTIPADSGGTLVFINGSRGKWLRITSAVNTKKEKIFEGTGWVYAPLLAVNLIGGEDDLVDFYEKPSTTPASDDSIRPAFNPFLMLGCSGDWIQLSVPVRGVETGEPGWFPRGSYCGTPWGDCR
jgi:hypothetical protein